jgi:hypothetical protein
LVVPGGCGVVLKQEEGVQVEDDGIIKVEIRIVP